MIIFAFNLTLKCLTKQLIHLFAYNQRTGQSIARPGYRCISGFRRFLHNHRAGGQRTSYSCQKYFCESNQILFRRLVLLPITFKQNQNRSNFTQKEVTPDLTKRNRLHNRTERHRWSHISNICRDINGLSWLAMESLIWRHLLLQ